jgi:hypothetical protein
VIASSAGLQQLMIELTATRPDLAVAIAADLSL